MGLGSDPELKATSSASLTYTAAPVAAVCCGSYSSPDCGCKAEQADSEAAYADALIFAITGDAQYAQKAVEIMNAWSSTIQMQVPTTTSCSCNGPSGVSSNTPVQSGWVGSVFPRAAEIIRALYPMWAQADIDKFKMMLQTVFLPNLINGAPKENGNWELSIAEALIQIGVFLDLTIRLSTKASRFGASAFPLTST